MQTHARDAADSPALRKARGAYFTPPEIARFLASWAVRDPADQVLEPSSGDAEFLAHSATRLQELGVTSPVVHGVELHEYSAQVGSSRVAALGGRAAVVVGDFFAFDKPRSFDAVVGNPPYIRFQDFTGEARARAQAAALRGGVRLSGLASAWAAFTVHSALQLVAGGRLGFVLPAELLTANYAAPVRTFLFERFRSVELILFAERAFAEAETETVLLLADGYDQGPTDHALVRQVQTSSDLGELPPGVDWSPENPADKWSWSALAADVFDTYRTVLTSDAFTELGEWGRIRLGAVTGNNKFFTLTPERAQELGLAKSDLLRLSPPGSTHLRGLELSSRALSELGKKGKRTLLLRPSGEPSAAAQRYIEAGETAGVDTAYKCRVRKPWWRTPVMDPADILLTYMNADTPRIVTNTGGAYHLNSVHGVYLHEQFRDLGRSLLPLASLNSMTLLGAETVGRAYGGGLLKMEPGEAVKWPMPAPALIESVREDLVAVRPQVAGRLRQGKLLEAVAMVDQILLVSGAGVTFDVLKTLREARAVLSDRRETRSRGVKS